MRSASKPKAGSSEERNIISNKLLVENTGETLEFWFQELDKKGGQKLSRGAIFEIVTSIPGLEKLSEWNQHLLTTSYEWSRGLRQRGEKKPGDFEASLSKTINVPLRMLFDSFTNESSRSKWLKEKGLEFRKTTELKSCRVTWSDGTSLSVDFYDKGKNKSQITVQHQKITTAADREKRKEYWTEMLGRLKEMLEKPGN
jgi:uncharacterized protein YndB with AHSA1/START domain